MTDESALAIAPASNVKSTSPCKAQTIDAIPPRIAKNKPTELIAFKDFIIAAL